MSSHFKGQLIPFSHMIRISIDMYRQSVIQQLSTLSELLRPNKATNDKSQLAVVEVIGLRPATKRAAFYLQRMQSRLQFQTKLGIKLHPLRFLSIWEVGCFPVSSHMKYHEAAEICRDKLKQASKAHSHEGSMAPLFWPSQPNSDQRQ